MFSLNRVHLIGYQTQPVSVRKTPGGTSVTDLNVVVPTTFRSESGDALTGKSFHTVTLWGATADIAGQFLKAGGQVFVAGRLQTDSWDDESTGEKRSKTKVVAQELILLDPKSGQTAAPAGAKLLAGGCNRADLIGNVTRDPEMRTTTGGQKVLTIGVATNDRWKDRSSGEMKERSEFHNVVVWGELAEETAAHIRKGSKVYVTGRVQTRSWETQSGAKRTTTEVIAEAVSLLGISNPLAQESVQADLARQDNQQHAPDDHVPATSSAPSASSFGEDPAPDLGSIPAIKYETDVKVENLPF